MSLEHLKVGDKIAVTRKYHQGGYDILTIDGETATQWKTGHLRWRKSNGWLVGADKWDFRSAKEITPELQERINKQIQKEAHLATWRKIRELGCPKHVTTERLKEILDELSTPPAGKE